MRITAAALLAALLSITPATAAPYRGPIIDVHQHSYPEGDLSPALPMSALRADIPAAYAGQLGARTGAGQRAGTLEAMRRRNIVLAIQSYGGNANGLAEEMSAARAVLSASGGRILSGVSLRPLTAKAPPAEIAAAFRAGEMVALGELAIQYIGKTAADPAFEPYLAMAEAADMPVAIHTGSGPPRSSAHGSPDFRLRHGNPLLIEEALVRHPRLRVSLMHAGWPYLQETKGLLNQYPELHADLGAISWVLPKAEFHAYLKALVDAGFSDRLMFGSDQMNWPAAIDLAVETIDAAPFLSAEQKKAIFHDNAVRFYRLEARLGGKGS